MIMWTHNLCIELKLRRTKKSILYEDNQAVIQVIKEVRSSYKVKTVDLTFHKICDFVERGILQV